MRKLRVVQWAPPIRPSCFNWLFFVTLSLVGVCLLQSKYREDNSEVYKNGSFPPVLLSSHTSIFSKAPSRLEHSSEQFTNQILKYFSIRATLLYNLISSSTMPSFNRSTTGTEVVEAFADRVNGKTCNSPPLPSHLSRCISNQKEQSS